MGKIKYVVEDYIGRWRGQWTEEVGIQIVALDAVTGKRRAVFRGPNGGRTPCRKWECGYRHRITGCPKWVVENLRDTREKAQKEAATLTALEAELEAETGE